MQMPILLGCDASIFVYVHMEDLNVKFDAMKWSGYPTSVDIGKLIFLDS